MALGKIAILSSNKSFSRFFELEVKYKELDVCVIDNVVADLSEFDLAVIDIDTVEHIPDFESSKTVFVSSKGKFPDFCKYSMCLEWPVCAKQISELYNGIKLKSETIQEPSCESRDIIYFYKEEPRTIRYKNKNIFLSENESKLLELLCQNSSQPVTRDRLNAILGATKGNIVDVYICKLRKKIEEPFSQRLIFTVRDKGYKIIVGMERE